MDLGNGIIVCEVRPTDYAPLEALYNSTDGANWTTSTNWLSGKPLGTWHGVSTDTNGRVTHLALSNNGLSGELPSELGDLSSDRLLLIRLDDNELTGGIPGELSKLASLDRLDLSDNQLTGKIPSEFGALTRIHYLHLDNNQLSGTLPVELTQIPVGSHLHLYVQNNSGICAPTELNFQLWLKGIGGYSGETCTNQGEHAPSSLDAAMIELVHEEHDHDEDDHDEDSPDEDDHDEDDEDHDEDDHEMGVYMVWTPGSDPNYVKQIVKRRELGVRPAQWTTFDVSKSAYEYTDETADVCKRYIYRVQGMRQNGNGAMSNRVVLMMQDDECAPRDLTAAVNNGTVTLSWTPSIAEGVTNQIIKRREAGVRPAQWTTVAVTATADEYTDTDVESGKQYIYRVQVEIGHNNSKLSKPVSVRVP